MVTTKSVSTPSRFFTISTTKIQTCAVIFLLISMAPFCTYVVPYLIPGLCLHMMFPSLSLLPLYLHWILLLLFWIRSWPYFQHAPWLRAVPYVGYLHVSIPWSLHEMSQTLLLVGIKKYVQVCALWCSMKFICCCFQLIPQQRNNVYRCACNYQYTTSYLFPPYFLQSDYPGIECSV